ncbi:MAG: sigma 54-interacting transcriptional regulator [Bilophila wadsworthia]
MLDLPPDAVHGNIQDIIFSSDIIRAILSESGQFSDQEAFRQLKGGSLNCMLSLTRLESGKGRVLTLRETKRIKESAVRVTGAKAVYTFDHIVGNAPATQEVVRMARMAAQSDVTTLILGESGTGKELFAQSIHNGGRRANAPFVVVNQGTAAQPRAERAFGYDEGSLRARAAWEARQIRAGGQRDHFS